MRDISEVVLQPATEEDMEFFYELRQDPDVIRASEGAPLLSADHALWFLDALENPEHCLFTIGVNNSDKPIGTIRVHFKHNGIGKAEISIAIVPEFRGMGVGSAAIHILTNHLVLANYTPYARIKRDNLASARAFEKNGVEIEWV